jgi:hypothetical protein
MFLRKDAEKKKQDSLRLVMLKKEKAELDSIAGLPLKRRKELLELRNKKKLQEFREAFSKRPQLDRFWKFDLPRPVKKPK